ncbi:glycosyltransferase family 2 protein, partial [Candidatus Roizmanbacteria bacterium]|nr:glycosyltransferase family 2 protein [Candidatus Roizmanbacteria bacterium]
MKSRLSLLMITFNAEELLERSLRSCQGLVEEIVVVDNYSKDKTHDIAQKYGAKIYLNEEDDLGKQRAYGLKKATGDWALVLDSDEIISDELKSEIKLKVKS